MLSIAWLGAYQAAAQDCRCHAERALGPIEWVVDVGVVVVGSVVCLSLLVLVAFDKLSSVLLMLMLLLVLSLLSVFLLLFLLLTTGPHDFMIFVTRMASKNLWHCCLASLLDGGSKHRFRRRCVGELGTQARF